MCAGAAQRAKCFIRPSNAIREKRFLTNAGLPLTPYREVTQHPRVCDAAVGELGLPAVLKSAAFGYDGKGQFDDSRSRGYRSCLGSKLAQARACLEAFIDFEREISVVAARGLDGSFVHYGAIENHHSRHILDVSLSPARIPAQVNGRSGRDRAHGARAAGCSGRALRGDFS